MKLMLLLTCFLGLIPGYGYTSSLQELLNGLMQDPTYGQSHLTTQIETGFITDAENTFKVATGEIQLPDGNPYTGYTPTDLEEAYAEHALGLYKSGYAKKIHFDFYQTKYEEIKTLQVPSGMDPKVFWWAKYRSVFDGYILKIKGDPQNCSGEGVLAGYKNCCRGLLKLSQFKKIKNNCLPGPDQCSSHDDCCSGVCIRENNQMPGVCASASLKNSGEACSADTDCLSGLCAIDSAQNGGTCAGNFQCYRLVNQEQSCVESNDHYCGEGDCFKFEKSAISGSCKEPTVTCAANTECCSESCVAGKCKEKALCKKCVGSGATPAAGEECCPGFYLNPTTNKCRARYNPLILTPGSVYYKKPKSLIKRIVDLIFPTAHAAGGTCPNGVVLTEPQRTLLASKTAQCALRPLAEREDCLRSVDTLRATYCADSTADLTQEQQAFFDGRRELCNANHPSGSQELKDCLNQVLEAERAQQGSGEGQTVENRYDDYINKYNAPTLSAKTYSDIRKCEFHSFNDGWKNASNTERNAELFLRSFEFTFSGDGTKDYWQDGSAGNIFGRANKAAKILRTNRARIMDSYNQIDHKMTCKCLAIFGPSQFSAEKQQYFNTSCDEYKAELTADMGTNGEASQINGTSISSTNDDQVDTAKIEEIDKGASGISYEKLLIEYTRLRAEHMIDAFLENDEVEQDMMALSEFINETDFEETWKDDVQNGTTHVPGSPAGHSVKIYKWGWRYLNGFFSFIVALVTGGLALFTGNLFNGASNSNNFAMSGMTAAYGPDASTFPEVKDAQKERKSKWDLLHKYDGYERWYVGPRFDNESTVDATHCEIKGRAAACLKSAYEFKPGVMKYLNDFPTEGRYIIDPKRPAFVTATQIHIDTMYGINKTWMQVINETVDQGVNFLQNQTKPEVLASKRLKYKNGYSVTRSGSDYKSINVMEMAFNHPNKYFVPLRGEYTPPAFNDTHKNILVTAATKYAMCKKLFDNTENVACNGGSGTAEGDIGFGNLFESEAEAREWAEYTYEMHYVYSSVTKDDYMGYPLIGANAYYEAVAYKIKLLNGIYATRAQNLAELADLYESDLEKRLGLYNALGGATNGTESKNIKYSKRIFDLFQTLDFTGHSDLEQFRRQVAEATASNSLSGADLAATDRMANAIARRNKLAKEQTALAKITKKNSLVDLASVDPNVKNLLSPISAIKKAAPTGAFAVGNLGNKLDSINKKLEQLGKNKAAAKIESRFKAPGFTMPSYSPPTTTNNDTETTAQNSDASGMKGAEVDKLLNSLNKNKGLLARMEADTLFTIVSKAYKRNYGKVLTRSKVNIEKTKETISNKEQDELRKLLDN